MIDFIVGKAKDIVSERRQKLGTEKNSKKSTKENDYSIAQLPEAYPIINPDTGRKTPVNFHKSFLTTAKKYYEERGIKVPKHINPDDVQGYVKHVTSAKKRGGTNLRNRKPTPSIMELPTVGKRN